MNHDRDDRLPRHSLSLLKLVPVEMVSENAQTCVRACMHK